MLLERPSGLGWVPSGIKHGELSPVVPVQKCLLSHSLPESSQQEKCLAGGCAAPLPQTSAVSSLLNLYNTARTFRSLGS